MQNKKNAKEDHANGTVVKIRNINLFQLSLLLIHAQVGVGMITLASDVHVDAKTSSWISVLLGGIFVQLLIFIYGFLMKRFPNKTLFDMIKIVFGNIIGKLIIIMYVLYFIILIVLLLSKFIVIIKTWMMPITPKWVLTVFLSIIAIYAAKENIHVISRFFIFATFVIFVFLGFVFYSFKDANYTYILPIGIDGFRPILKGAITSSNAYQGIEYLLLVAPFVKGSNKQVLYTSTFINVFITLFYTLTVLAPQLVFSSKELELITEPIFYLVKSFSFTMIERPDLLFVTMWIVLVITTLIMLLFAASMSLQSVFNSNQQTIFVYIVITVSIVLSSFIYGEFRIRKLSMAVNPLIFLFAAGIPIITLLFSYLFRKKAETK